MKLVALAVALSALASHASAHYIFEYLDSYGQYQYIRKNINNNSPVTDLSSNDLCYNVGGETSSGTTTVSVAAGFNSYLHRRHCRLPPGPRLLLHVPYTKRRRQLRRFRQLVQDQGHWPDVLRRQCDVGSREDLQRHHSQVRS